MLRPGKLICFISLGLGLILSKMPMDAGNIIEGSSCYGTRLQVPSCVRRHDAKWS